jgi:dipeptidyl aminopeptidase/acylaminoacyl peptidase
VLVSCMAFLLAAGCGRAGAQSAAPPDSLAPSAPGTAAPAPDTTSASAVPVWNPAGEFNPILTRITDGITEIEVSYPSGPLTVRGFLFLPPGTGRCPGVLFNHGGVSGVSDDMRRRGRDLARLGYVVLAPAYRGEGGSDGRVEVAAGEVDDVLAAARLLARHPRVDAARLAVTGSSHGALVSVLAAAREPSLFRCVVEASGVMDVVSWYHYLVANDFDVSDSLSVAVYGKGPEDKPEAFSIRRAVRVADRITMPLLIQQGAKDTTVPSDQGRQFEQAVTDAGNARVTRLEYPLLGHAFWFWNDPRYHSQAELAEAERAWSDFTQFLSGQLKGD